jgi:MFS transporter, DHA1 family, tetracycline resistance protein
MVASLSGAMAFMGINAVFGPALRKFGVPDWQAGAILSVAGVFLLASSAAWGRLSNRIGRRKVVMIGLSGLCAGLLLLAGLVQVALHTTIALGFLVLGLFSFRAMMNLFYGSVAVASQAWVADNHEPSKRSKAMGAIGAAQGMGMILGPALAAVLSRVDLVVPFWTSAVLPLLGVAAVWWFLPHSDAPAQPAKHVKLSFWDTRIRMPVLTAFTCMFVIMTAQLTLGFLAIDLLKLSTNDAAGAAGAALTSVGVAFFMAQVIVSKLGWEPRRLALIGAPIGAIGFGLTPLILPFQPLVLVMCLGFFVSAFGLGFLWPAFQAGSVNAVRPDEAGEASGHVSAALGAAAVIGPLSAGLLYEVSPTAPYFFDGLMLVALFLLWRRT